MFGIEEISRICIEYDELYDRLTKLKVALNKDGFREKVGDFQYKLMKEQVLGMEKYYNALKSRMQDMGIFGDTTCCPSC